MCALGVSGWENGTDHDVSVIPLGGGDPCPVSEGVQQRSQPLSPCSPGHNLSRGSAARWRGASPSQAGERGLLIKMQGFYYPE